MSEKVGRTVDQSGLVAHTPDVVQPDREGRGASSIGGADVGPRSRPEYMHAVSVQALIKIGHEKSAN